MVSALFVELYKQFFVELKGGLAVIAAASRVLTEVALIITRNVGKKIDGLKMFIE